jgi:transposase
MDTTTPPLASIGIDIGKEVFHIVGFGVDGKIAFRRKIKRLALIETFKRLPASIVGMEACLSAHFVSRALRQLGHEPRIMYLPIYERLEAELDAVRAKEERMERARQRLK